MTPLRAPWRPTAREGRAYDGDGDRSLVPLLERIRWLQLTRAGLVVGAVGAAALGALGPRGTVGLVGAVGLAHVALGAVTLLAPRVRRRSAVTMSGIALLLDGVLLASVTYAVAGFRSATIALVLLHAVAVTLLASFRTGLKVAIWHTLVMASVFELSREGMITPEDAPTARDLVVAIGFLWLVTLATASFAAVNEREIRRRNFDLLALTRFSLSLEQSLRPADVGEALLQAVREDQGVTRAVLLAAVGGRLERVAGLEDNPVPPGVAADGDAMTARAVAEHRTLRVARLDRDRDPWLAQALPGARNLIVVPVYADGERAGVLVAEHGSARGSRVEARVQSMLERYASHAALALTNARLLAQMRRLADTDGLTGVANRRTFDRTVLDEAMVADAQGRALSLVLVDLDHFKRLNDTFGHQVGDDVLRRAAAALVGACRPTDLVARYGGEEFAVVLPGAGPGAARDLAERLRRAVTVATADGPGGGVTASLGVAVAPAGGVGVTDLLGAADRALYRSKADGRDRVTMHVIGSGELSPTSG